MLFMVNGSRRDGGGRRNGCLSCKHDKTLTIMPASVQPVLHTPQTVIFVSVTIFVMSVEVEVNDEWGSCLPLMNSKVVIIMI